MDTRTFITVKFKNNQCYVLRKIVQVPSRILAILKGKGEGSSMTIDKALLISNNETKKDN
jgi:hypothetical protein